MYVSNNNKTSANYSGKSRAKISDTQKSQNRGKNRRFWEVFLRPGILAPKKVKNRPSFWAENGGVKKGRFSRLFFYPRKSRAKSKTYICPKKTAKIKNLKNRPTAVKETILGGGRILPFS
jgi:hypothetical protein